MKGIMVLTNRNLVEIRRLERGELFRTDDGSLGMVLGASGSADGLLMIQYVELTSHPGTTVRIIHSSLVEPVNVRATVYPRTIAKEDS